MESEEPLPIASIKEEKKKRRKSSKTPSKRNGDSQSKRKGKKKSTDAKESTTAVGEKEDKTTSNDLSNSGKKKESSSKKKKKATDTKRSTSKARKKKAIVAKNSTTIATGETVTTSSNVSSEALSSDGKTKKKKRSPSTKSNRSRKSKDGSSIKRKKKKATDGTSTKSKSNKSDKVKNKTSKKKAKPKKTTDTRYEVAPSTETGTQAEEELPSVAAFDAEGQDTTNYGEMEEAKAAVAIDELTPPVLYTETANSSDIEESNIIAVDTAESTNPNNEEAKVAATESTTPEGENEEAQHPAPLLPTILSPLLLLPMFWGNDNTESTNPAEEVNGVNNTTPAIDIEDTNEAENKESNGLLSILWPNDNTESTTPAVDVEEANIVDNTESTTLAVGIVVDNTVSTTPDVDVEEANTMDKIRSATPVTGVEDANIADNTESSGLFSMLWANNKTVSTTPIVGIEEANAFDNTEPSDHDVNIEEGHAAAVATKVPTTPVVNSRQSRVAAFVAAFETSTTAAVEIEAVTIAVVDDTEPTDHTFDVEEANIDVFGDCDVVATPHVEAPRRMDLRCDNGCNIREVTFVMDIIYIVLNIGLVGVGWLISNHFWGAFGPEMARFSLKAIAGVIMGLVGIKGVVDYRKWLVLATGIWLCIDFILTIIFFHWILAVWIPPFYILQIALFRSLHRGDITNVTEE